MSNKPEILISNNGSYVEKSNTNDNKILNRLSPFDFSNSIGSIKRDDLSYTNYDRIQEVALVNILERRLYDLLLEGRNDVVKDLIDKYKDLSSPLLDKWREVFSKSLKNKTVKASLQNNEIESEKELIDKARKLFFSKWIAISCGKVLASNEKLEDLKGELQKQTGEITFVKL